MLVTSKIFVRPEFWQVACIDDIQKGDSNSDYHVNKACIWCVCISWMLCTCTMLKSLSQYCTLVTFLRATKQYTMRFDFELITNYISEINWCVSFQSNVHGKSELSFNSDAHLVIESKSNHIVCGSPMAHHLWLTLLLSWSDNPNCCTAFIPLEVRGWNGSLWFMFIPLTKSYECFFQISSVSGNIRK